MIRMRHLQRVRIHSLAFYTIEVQAAIVNTETLRDALTSELREDGVDKLINEYSQMRRRFQEEEYAEVGISVGRFCEAMVSILDYKFTSKLDDKSVREFAQASINDEIGESYPPAINQHIPNMLHTAYDIRSNRDSAHVNFDTAVNRTDARVGTALCASMLVELTHEFIDEDKIEDVDDIVAVLDQLADPIEQSPLDSLVASKYDFDHEEVANLLDGLIIIVDEDNEVEPGLGFFDLNVKEQVTALALGRLAAYKRDIVYQIGAKENWYTDRVDAIGSVDTKLEESEFIRCDFSDGGYHIPGYQVKNAIEVLSEAN